MESITATKETGRCRCDFPLCALLKTWGLELIWDPECVSTEGESGVSLIWISHQRSD